MKIIGKVSVPHDLNRDREVILNGEPVWASLAPQDVPREVLVKRENKDVQMELRYGTSYDPALDTQKLGDTRVSVSPESGRLLFLDYQGALDLEALRSELQQLADDSLARDPDHRRQRLHTHYAFIVEDVLPLVASQLKHELMLASR